MGWLREKQATWAAALVDEHDRAIHALSTILGGVVIE